MLVAVKLSAAGEATGELDPAVTVGVGVTFATTLPAALDQQPPLAGL